MRNKRVLRFVLIAVLGGILISVFTNFLFPVVLNSRILFGGLVGLLFIGGLVSAVIAMRAMLRR